MTKNYNQNSLYNNCNKIHLINKTRSSIMALPKTIRTLALPKSDVLCIFFYKIQF